MRLAELIFFPGCRPLDTDLEGARPGRAGRIVSNVDVPILSIRERGFAIEVHRTQATDRDIEAFVRTPMLERRPTKDTGYADALGCASYSTFELLLSKFTGPRVRPAMC